MEKVLEQKKQEKETNSSLIPGMFASGKWRSAVILKFSPWMRDRCENQAGWEGVVWVDGLKNQSGSLFLMITVQAVWRFNFSLASKRRLGDGVLR